MAISFHQTTLEDAAELDANLLQADRQEILAMGFEPLAGIEQSIRTSIDAVTIRKDGELACIVGICRSTDLADVIRPWLLSTKVVLDNPFVAARLSKVILAKWRAQYPYMSNWVDARHWRAIHWLRWLGAELAPAEPFGPFKRPFHKFTFGAPDVH